MSRKIINNPVQYVQRDQDSTKSFRSNDSVTKMPQDIQTIRVRNDYR
jgi:hypothetical protein